MVKIVCNNYIGENGVWGMAQELMYASCGSSWADTYDEVSKKYVPTTYDCLILDFKPHVEAYGEDFCMEPRDGYYSEEDIQRWRDTQVVKFPPINVHSVKITRQGDNALIEIESDNDYEVRKLFYLFADLGNCGHCFGGVIKIRERCAIGDFGFDGDGCDYIESIDEDDNL